MSTKNSGNGGVLVRSLSSVEEVMKRRDEHYDLLVSAADRRDKDGNISDARHYRRMAEATSRNLTDLKRILGHRV